MSGRLALLAIQMVDLGFDWLRLLILEHISLAYACWASPFGGLYSAPMISVCFPGHSSDAAVNSVSVSISISVPLIVSLVAINTPHGAPLSVFAYFYVVAT